MDEFDEFVWFFVSWRDEYCCTTARTFEIALIKASTELFCEPEDVRLIVSPVKIGRLVAKNRL